MSGETGISFDVMMEVLYTYRNDESSLLECGEYLKNRISDYTVVQLYTLMATINGYIQSIHND